MSYDKHDLNNFVDLMEASPDIEKQRVFIRMSPQDRARKPPEIAPEGGMRGPTDFEKLDRDARLAVLREVQHHSGIESDEYMKLARAHEYALNKANGGGSRRPIR